MALIIAEELHIADFDEKNLKCCCPFHQEDTPSFIWNSKALSFHCFGACGRSYDIIDVFMLNGCTYIEAVQKLFELANIKYAFGEHKVKTNAQYKYPKGVPVNDKEKITAYYKNRKISRKTLDYADVREDEYGNIVFNYYDLNDTLCMVKFRPSRKIQHGEIKNWCEKGSDTAPLLFNMNRINTDNPLLICCGESDALAAIEVGYTNVVSIPLGDQNTHWVEHCWDFLEQFDSIIICSDNDTSGMKFQKDIVYRLGSWRTKIADLPTYYEDESGKRVNVKDLNEALYYYGKKKTLEIIINAKDSPVASVRDLSDIEDINLDEIDGIYTGITGIDKELMKIFYGTLTIVSGTPGSGKTSFLYQIICQALDQDKNCWLFSKELPEWMTKNWFNYIFAGRRNIKQYTDTNGAEYFKVTDQAKKDINDYYRGKWFVYRDDNSCKLDDLIQSMTDVVRKYGVKLLILDNLMTIDLDARENNELQKQTETINKLIHFSTKYNVAVILVAHPRKLQNTSEVGMYDISGSSNIINLAHRTIGLRRVTDREKKGRQNPNGKGWSSPPVSHDAIFSVIKDRIRGRANFHYGLFYDVPSRRFFSNPDEFAYNYMWDKNNYSGKIEYPIKDLESEVYG